MATLNINLDNVQPTLVSGTNIKTINGATLLGSTDIALQTVLVSGTSIKTVNGTSILGSGDLTIASGISIGDTIGSGTAGSVLFLGTSGVLAQDNANLRYTTGGQLEIGLAVNNPSFGDRLKIRASDNSGLASIWVENLAGTLVFAVYSSKYIQIGNNADLIYSSSNSGYFAFQSGGSGFSFDKKVAIGFNGIGSASMLHIKATSASDTVIIAQGTTSQTGNLYENRLVAGTVISGWDANGNLFSNTGSGIQLATADTQKIGFYGATPVTRADAMATSISYASVGGTSLRVNDTWGGYTILTAIATLKGLGILP